MTPSVGTLNSIPETPISFLERIPRNHFSIIFKSLNKVVLLPHIVYTMDLDPWAVEGLAISIAKVGGAMFEFLVVPKVAAAIPDPFFLKIASKLSAIHYFLLLAHLFFLVVSSLNYTQSFHFIYLSPGCTFIVQICFLISIWHFFPHDLDWTAGLEILDLTLLEKSPSFVAHFIFCWLVAVGHLFLVSLASQS